MPAPTSRPVNISGVFFQPASVPATSAAPPPPYRIGQPDNVDLTFGPTVQPSTISTLNTAPQEREQVMQQTNLAQPLATSTANNAPAVGTFQPASFNPAPGAASYVSKQPVYSTAGGHDYGSFPPNKGYVEQMIAVLDLLTIFPNFFTIMCFGVFAVPLYLCYHIGREPSVAFWIGDYILWILLSPTFYILTHIVHVVTQRPNKLLIILCVCGSCAMVAALALSVLMEAETKRIQLITNDCDAFPEKRELQEEWNAARVFYANCAFAKSQQMGISFDEAVYTYRIEDCPSYKEKASEHPHWSYLRNLEMEQQCAGWCTREYEMWTHEKTMNSCSSTVASIFKHEITKECVQAITYSLIVQLVVTYVLILLGPVMRKAGVLWEL